MNIPDEFGLFPFQRFTADELRHFFVWCAAHKVSDVDLTGGINRRSSLTELSA